VLTIYGIPNCDTCRKARKFLDARETPYRFHDLRADGVSAEMLDRWLAAIEWKTLMNTRSTTWRGLADNDKSDMNTDKAKALMLAHPTLIKRPVAEAANHVSVGFSTERYEKFQGK